MEKKEEEGRSLEVGEKKGKRKRKRKERAALEKQQWF